MATVADQQEQSQQRFYQLLKRSAQVARLAIESEGQATPISDEARLRGLNVLSYALQDASAWPETAQLLLALTTKMEMAGYREEWLYYLEKGLAQSQQQGDERTAAALHFHCGHLYRLLSRHEPAQHLLQNSASSYAALGDKQGQAQALNQLAYLAWQQQQYSEGEHYVQRALELVEEGSLEQAVSFSVSGLMAVEQNRPQAAERLHSAALQIRMAHGNQRLTAWSLQNIAVALDQQGQHDQALTNYQQALALLEQVHDPGYQAIVQINLAIAYYTLNQPAPAFTIIQTAEQTFRSIFDNFNLARALTTKGLCQLALQQWQAAEETFAESAQLFQDLGNYSWHLNSLDGLGISYLEREQYDKAQPIFEFIFAHLSQIEGTLPYTYLSATVPNQLEQVRNKRVKRGQSTYLSPQKQDQQPPGAGPQAKADGVNDDPVAPSNKTGA